MNPENKNRDDLVREVIKRNVETLKKDTESIKSTYVDSLREMQLDFYLKHFRYILYAYFRYGVDLLNISDANKSIVFDWRWVTSDHIVDNNGNHRWEEDSITKEIKLVDGEGVEKKHIVILPPLINTFANEDISKNDVGVISGTVREADKAYGVHKSYGDSIINSRLGEGFSNLLPDANKQAIRIKEFRVKWIKTIEEVDNWIKRNKPHIYGRLTPLPTLDRVNKDIENLKNKHSETTSPNSKQGRVVIDNAVNNTQPMSFTKPRKR